MDPVNPCVPSPCGPNSICKETNDIPSCSCLSDFIGSPPNCRPECISNNECPNDKACMNNKCRNPCKNACGLNTDCHVVSHTPMCVCIDSHTGDPFSQCTLIQRKSL